MCGGPRQPGDAWARRAFLRALLASGAAIALGPAAAHARGRRETCDVCRTTISGRYNEYRLENGIRWHVCAACETRAQRCARCNVPFPGSEFRTFGDGSRWCRECVARTPACDACRKPILGRYYQFEHVPGTWCAACFQAHAQCDVCQRPMHDGSEELPDGRTICRACTASAIRGTEQLNRIARTLAPQIEQFLGAPFTPPPIRAVAREELLDAYARYTGERREYTGTRIRELGLYIAGGGTERILVLDALPEDLAWETVAHELAHAWQHQNIPQCRELALVEGFAQWVAEEMCHRNFRRTGLELLRTRPDFYGQAYRMVNQLHVTRGRDGLFEAMRANELPTGMGG